MKSEKALLCINGFSVMEALITKEFLYILTDASPPIFDNPYLLIGLISYFISTIIWIVALSRVSVSIAYPMISLGYVFVALAAWFLFNEPLSPIKLLALGIIIFGIILLAHSSN